MVAIKQRRVRCIVVRVPAEADLFAERGALAHEISPDADPYVARLIRNLQDEVRHERQVEFALEQAGVLPHRPRFSDNDLRGDLEIPWFDLPMDDEPLGEEQLPEFGNEN
jgi:hypothetical protein